MLDLTSALKRWTADSRGGVAMITAIAAPVLAILTATAIEYSTLERARASAQAHLDAGLLAAARSSAKTDAQRSAVVQAMMDGAEDGFLKNMGVVANAVAVDDEHLTAEAVLHAPALFAGLLGGADRPIRVNSEVKLGLDQELELALALDTTYSMTGSKIDTLKIAAKDMADALMVNDGVRMSVVPFARYVHLGVEYRDKPWMDVPKDEAGEKKCEMKPEYRYFNCKTSTYDCTKDGVKKTCTSKSCDKEKIGEKMSCSTSGASKWNGCVGSRLAPYNTRVAFAGKKIPGLMNVGCNAKLTRLTNTKASVTNAINALGVNDETYIPSGLMWGWRTLSPDSPFADGKDPATADVRVRKALVLMTDGENTISQKPGDTRHTGTSRSDADAMTESLCDAIKDEDIEVFTIAFEVSGVSTKKLLQDCATSSEHFFDAKDSAALRQAFDEIGRYLMVPYVAS